MNEYTRDLRFLNEVMHAHKFQSYDDSIHCNAYAYKSLDFIGSSFYDINVQVASITENIFVIGWILLA